MIQVKKNTNAIHFVIRYKIICSFILELYFYRNELNTSILPVVLSGKYIFKYVE